MTQAAAIIKATDVRPGDFLVSIFIAGTRPWKMNAIVLTVLQRHHHLDEGFIQSVNLSVIRSDGDLEQIHVYSDEQAEVIRP